MGLTQTPLLYADNPICILCRWDYLHNMKKIPSLRLGGDLNMKMCQIKYAAVVTPYEGSAERSLWFMGFIWFWTQFQMAFLQFIVLHP